MASDFSARLTAARSGDPVAISEAFEASYDELRRIARVQLRSMRPGETLRPTALVNEAFLRLVGHCVVPADQATLPFGLGRITHPLSGGRGEPPSQRKVS